MSRQLRYNIVDVFTDTPFTGNALAVFTNAKGLSTESMQSIAREMNLSETVFFLPPEQGGHARLRIFTPNQELPFAGHPVLGSAWVLGHPMEMGQLRLETGAGIIVVDLRREGGELHVAHMMQPLPSFETCNFADELDQALGLQAWPERLATTAAQNGPRHVLVEAKSVDELDTLRPDFGAMAQLTEAGVLVYAQGEGAYFARYFAPAAGIPEDPATGSAAGPLGAYLVMKGRHEAGSQLILRQGLAMRRPSQLLVKIEKDGEAISAVRVGGSAIVVGRGELKIQ